MNELTVEEVLDELDNIDNILDCEGANSSEIIDFAKEAVLRMKKYPLKDMNKSATQGHCECGRIVYRDFKVCPLCEKRLLWPEVILEKEE